MASQYQDNGEPAYMDSSPEQSSWTESYCHAIDELGDVFPPGFDPDESIDIDKLEERQNRPYEPSGRIPPHLQKKFAAERAASIKSQSTSRLASKPEGDIQKRRDFGDHRGNSTRGSLSQAYICSY